MGEIQERVEKLRAAARRRDAEFMRDRDDRECEHRAALGVFSVQSLPHLRPAHAADYRAWLRGYMERGADPTHFYDYPIGRCKFYVATGDLYLPPLCGASSVRVIVPVGLTVDAPDLGHNQVYHMDGFVCRGGLVPVYEDTAP